MGITPSSTLDHSGTFAYVPDNASGPLDAVKAPLPPDPLILAIQELLGVDASVPFPTEALLTPLWRSPDAVHQLLLMKKGTNMPFPQAVASIPEAIAIAAKYSAKDYNVYHACGEFLSPDNRKASNATGACALWLDIDCGTDKAAAGKGYLSKAEAFGSLIEFCKKTGLPSPTHIVDSGGGLHVYWVFDRHIAAKQWRESAEKLKHITQTLGLKADATRTADIASILRLPGTLNFKTDPPVRWRYFTSHLS